MNQSGSGAAQYSLTKTSRRRIEKFQTTGVDYFLKVNNLNVSGLSHVLKTLDGLLTSILSDMTAGMADHDQIRFVMHSPQLNNPISLPFMPLKELTPRRLMFEIERVLQSHEEFVLGDGLHINLIHVKMPSGSGNENRKRCGVNLKLRLSRKRCVVTIKNKDELCAARAIVTGIAKVEDFPTYRYYAGGRPVQRTMALDLHNIAGVPMTPCGIEEIKLFQDVLPWYQLVVVSGEHFNSIIYKGPETEKPIYLYYHDGHYDLITSMPSFLGRAYYCLKCEKGYNTEDWNHHSCENKCKCCHHTTCTDQEEVGSWILCAQCHRTFKGPGCFENHQRVGVKNGKSVCQSYSKCQKCGKVSERSQGDHKCGEVRCPTCHVYDNPETHQCFMKPTKKKKRKRRGSDDEEEEEEEKKTKFLFFDFECMQETGVHVPNLVVVQDEEGHEWVFKGPNTCNDFCEWLFENMDRAVCIAHNFKGYDSYFILKYLYDNKVRPGLIMNGAKIMELSITDPDIRFIDSLNFLPMPLSKFPKTFGLTELAKGYFPHFFNTEANQHYVGPIPDAKYYDPDGMKPEAREVFYKWYDTQREKVFNMEEELLKYCRSDVDILRRCCLNFAQTVKGLCKINPFEHCITIASLCNLIFRTMFLKEETIAIIPHVGYRKKAKQSVVAYRWLSYVAHKQGVYIQHGRNVGERRVGPYFLDGCCEETRTAYEFHGCFYHGCPKCFPAGTPNPVSGLTMHELYERTQVKTMFLKQRGWQVVEMWECEFRDFLQRDAEAKEYVDGLKDIVDPLNPRDAFYGGRVNAVKLLVKTEANPTTKIKYVDFTSLYPDINKNGVYPVGHPIIFTENIHPDITRYFGLIQCDVLAPRGLYHPVLPFKCHNKLMFALCHTCTQETQQTSMCHHTDEKRMFTGTWVSLELNLAVEMGYKIVKIHEVWHFPDKTDRLFRDYIDMFLKKKQEASGWPGWCKTDEDKERYLQDYKDKEGIELDRDDIEYNAGARTVWKQILNNLWGKMGQRPNRPKTKVVTDPKDYFELLTSAGVEVTNVNLVNDEVVEMFYTMKDPFVEASDRTNVVLAAFTTAQARIKLYKVMRDLGRRVCYYDTDSVVYTVKEGEWEPPLGDHLGELTNELDDNDWIVTFVSAGPKNYAYKTHRGKTCCKVRGITLNFRTCEKVNFESMVDLVEKQDDSIITVHNPHKIIRDNTERVIVSQPQDKQYKIVYDKRVIQPDLDTLPYGY